MRKHAFKVFFSGFIPKGKCFFPLPSQYAHFRFWGHERLSDSSISELHPTAMPPHELEKRSTSKTFYALDTGFYWTPENALHERYEAERWCWVWMLQLTAQRWKNLAFSWYESSFYVGHKYFKLNWTKEDTHMNSRALYIFLALIAAI